MQIHDQYYLRTKPQVGTVLLLLHAHLPYVRHPDHKHHLEECWLFEAAIESYMPLFDLLLRLPAISPEARVALSVSPTLIEMLDDDMLSSRLMAHITRLIEMAEAESARTANDPDMNPVAQMYLERFRQTRDVLQNTYNGSLMTPLKELAQSPQVELLTTSATHAYLPNLVPVPNAVQRQIKVGLDRFEGHMGYRPEGFWLAECGYFEGLDKVMRQEGITHTFVSSSGLLHSRPRPTYGLYRPVCTPSGLVAFGRERKLSMKVWHGASGYPANPLYRDFYRDAGFDIDAPHIRDFVDNFVPGGHTYTGLKYHAVTGDTNNKKPYNPEAALMQAETDATHFTDTLANRAKEIKDTAGFSPQFTLPFDAELFGHWWSEGPEFLEQFIKKTCAHPNLHMALPSELATKAEEYQKVSPSLSSWGEGGYGHTWSDNRQEGKALARMLRETVKIETLLAHKTYEPDTLTAQAVAQAERELLMLQASDWEFMIHKDTAKNYAKQRINKHTQNLKDIYRMIDESNIDKNLLDKMKRHTPF